MKSEINYELALKYLNGSATEEEKAEFMVWVNASDENLIQLNELQKYWDLTTRAYENYQPDLESAWLSIQKEIAQKSNFSVKYIYRLAIAVVLIVSIGGFIRLYQNSEIHYRNKLIAYKTEKTTKEVRLEDGTVVWLNANSKLEAPEQFTSKKRKVYLSGEAYFEVAKDSLKPFIIKSKNTITEVLGTSFNIRAKEMEPEITVTVISGKVAFYNAKNKPKKTFLTSGMKGVWKEKTDRIISFTDENKNFLAWKTGILQFKDTPLQDVCMAIGSCYNINIEVDPGKAQEYQFTGNFKNAEIDQLLEIISLTLDVEFTKTNDLVHVNFKK